MKILSLLLVLITQICFAQTKIVEEIIKKIEFKEDTIQSVYNWITDNIKYDVNKLNQIKKGTTYSKHLKFKTNEEHNEYLLKNVIRQKKGVCEDYVLLFNAILIQFGYDAHIITGYTKNSEGKVQKTVSHAWNAVKNKGWKLYDPTWGAGYLEDERFVKKYNQEWFNVSFNEMIKTHMPFDPIWQLSNKPISYREFEKNLKVADSEGIYNYEELLEFHYNKGKKEQMQDEINRSIAIGDGIKLIDKWRINMLKNISFYGINSQQDLIKEANLNASITIELFNEYITAKNRRFKGKKWTINYAKQNLKIAMVQLESVLDIYKDIDIEDKGTIKSIKKNIVNAENLLERIKEELKYIEEFKSNLKSAENYTGKILRE